MIKNHTNSGFFYEYKILLNVFKYNLLLHYKCLYRNLKKVDPKLLKYS